MISRRRFLWLAGQAATSLVLPGCAASPPFQKDIFPDFGDRERPYLGLATSLRDEHDYPKRTRGCVEVCPAAKFRLCNSQISRPERY